MRMKIIILFILIFSIALNAQYHEKSQYSGVGMPFFNAELFRTFSEDGKSNRIVLFNEILYDDLTFVKGEDENYIAKIEFVIAVFSEADEQVFSKNIIKEVNEYDYELTNSRDKKIVLKNDFNLPAGNYEVKMQSNDMATDKSINRDIKLNLKEISESSIVLSDILLLENIITDSLGNLTDMIPHVKNNFPERIGHFYIYFDLFSEKIPKNIQIQYQFLTGDDEVEIDSVIVRQANEHVSGFYLKINKKKLEKNRYNIVIKIEDNQKTIERKKVISFYWVITPQTGEDISLAIRQMRYIIPEDSSDKYLDASLEEQKKYFRNFWTSRDPNPNSAINEILEEYFRRVNYSNKEYSTFNNNGWLSDRGRILIKFGSPEDIERHPFELNRSPYVVWRYFSLRKVFVFSDRSGFGDYQLLPEYYDQEWR